MRVSTFIYFVVLISVVIFMAVHEEVERVNSGYRSGELSQKEKRANESLEVLKERYARLASPERLKDLNRRLKLNLEPLPSVLPAQVAGGTEKN